MKPTDDVSPEIAAELDALPKSGGRGTRCEFTPEQDAILLRCRADGTTWDAMVAWWRRKYGWGARSTLQRRLHELSGRDYRGGGA